MNDETFKKKLGAMATTVASETGRYFSDIVFHGDRATVIYAIGERRHLTDGAFVSTSELAYVADINSLSNLSQVLRSLTAEGLTSPTLGESKERYGLTIFGDAAYKLLQQSMLMKSSRLPPGIGEYMQTLFANLDEVTKRSQQLSKT